ncbi:hypothetical protein GVN16_21405 [Emticicia sp. CRIBPO]|uniref:hypothetical protein n=1 Tax=Emticicia sp. CRIBPO TaxID=2683258 RepID=UPI001412876E|nr:hypothetical protein [Emticicia sp. CRIBPO]NBA88344.1 hypothetical protein [Emticicia sp. CRIBPO]
MTTQTTTFKNASILFVFLLSIFFSSAINPAFAQAEKKDDIQKKYGLSPDTPLISRISPAPERVLTIFHNAGMNPTEHALTPEEYKKVDLALKKLPALHQSVLKDHLASISFVDNMPNNALTSTLNTTDSFKVFNITIRAGILNQNVSDWLTAKEQTCFDTTNSDWSVSVDAGKLEALLYLLLHEGTHVVDGALAMMPLPENNADFGKNGFTSGIWEQRTTLASKYSDEILQNTRFRTGKVVPADKATGLYRALQQTPFVSLYSLSSTHEDLAEYLSVYHFTQKLGQPFRIIVRQAGKDVYTFEPMKSKLVKNRINTMKQFYGKVRG